MNGMRLGIDMDGVVADFNEGWIARYNRDFGTTITAEDIVVWNAPVELTHFRSMAEFWDWARACDDGRSVFRPLRPYPGAIEALGALADAGHRVVILTTKPDFAVHDTLAWLAEHRVPTTEVHILDDKSTVDCDLYVDDADHNLEVLAGSHPQATVCRYVRPWNRPHDGVVDVYSWADVTRVVDSKTARVD